MTAYDVFASGATGAPFLQYKRASFEDPEGTAVAFTIELQAKDLELITGLAERVGAPMRQTAATYDIVRDAVANGFADRDLSAIAVFLRGGEA
jgi:3-hydroxyisobutyrate dehydrogenase/2-hydroxy-3-oxopropionate reductase